MTWASLSLAYAMPERTNNQMMKECLAQFGYDYTTSVDERLNNTDWAEVSACTAGFIQEKHFEYVKKRKEFLKQNPWYRGPNWRWELRTEYSCTMLGSDVGPREVCHKPAYVQ